MIDNGEDRHNRPVKYTLTQAERQKLVERYFETKRVQQAESDLNLINAVRLREALQRLKGG